MFNSQMAGMGALPNVPTTKELWKNEKSKYRHWIILFGVGILAVCALFLTSFVMNLVNKNDNVEIIRKAMVTAAINSGVVVANPDTAYASDANAYFINNILIFSGIITAFISIGVALYIKTVYESYKKHSFSRLSNWASIAIGIGALVSAYQLISFAWKGPSGTTPLDFQFSGGIFQFINYFLIIAVYFSASIKVSSIRRSFQISERVEQLKNDPQYQAMQKQFQDMAGGGAFNGQMGPFGPIVTPTQQAEVQEQEPKVEKVVSTNPNKEKLEKMKLDDLKKVAEKLSISGFDLMNKKELIENILRVTEDRD